jgi:hypothetical protein
MDKKEIMYHVNNMEIGQRLEIPAYYFNAAFEHGWPTMYENAKDSFLSKMIGSAYGSFTVKETISGGDGKFYPCVIISRNEESSKRVYVDPDRRHLYDEIDGEFIYKGE